MVFASCDVLSPKQLQLSHLEVFVPPLLTRINSAAFSVEAIGGQQPQEVSVHAIKPAA